MPNLRKQTYGSGSPAWLGSAHGIRNARSAVLNLEEFTSETHYPAGFIPSGLPVDVADEGDVKPWNDTAGAVLGFVLFDQAVVAGGDSFINAPVLRHGLIVTEQLPIEDFAVPVTGDRTGFVFTDAVAAGGTENGGS